MKIEVKDGKVSLQIDGTFTVPELHELFFKIGQARAQIANDPQTLDNTETAIQVVGGMPYWTEFKPDLGMTMFAYLHPAFGWIGAMLPPVEVARLISLLGAQIGGMLTMAGKDPAASTPTTDNGHGTGGGMLH